jgi:hypothetical protein
VRLFVAIVLALAGSTVLWTSYSRTPRAAAESSDLVILDPATWAGKPFPILSDIDSSDRLQSGRWLVLLYHYDCDDCLSAIPRYEALAQSHPGYQMAFVAMPPLATDGGPVSLSADYLSLKLRPDHDWFATTPIFAALQDGVVVSAGGGKDAIKPPDIPKWDNNGGRQ